MAIKKTITNEIPILPIGINVNTVDWHVNTKSDFSGTKVLESLNDIEHVSKSFTYNFKDNEHLFVKVITKLSDSTTIPSDILRISKHDILQSSYTSYAPHLTISKNTDNTINASATKPMFFDVGSTHTSTTWSIETLSHATITEYTTDATSERNNFTFDTSDANNLDVYVVTVVYNYDDNTSSLKGRSVITQTNKDNSFTINTNKHFKHRTTAIDLVSPYRLDIHATIGGTKLPTLDNTVLIPSYLDETNLAVTGSSATHGVHTQYTTLSPTGVPPIFKKPKISTNNKVLNNGIQLGKFIFIYNNTKLITYDNTYNELQNISIESLQDHKMSIIDTNTFLLTGTNNNHTYVYLYMYQDGLKLISSTKIKTTDNYITTLIDGYVTIGQYRYNPYLSLLIKNTSVSTTTSTKQFHFKDNHITHNNVSKPYPDTVVDAYDTDDGIIIITATEIQHFDFNLIKTTLSPNKHKIISFDEITTKA